MAPVVKRSGGESRICNRDSSLAKVRDYQSARNDRSSLLSFFFSDQDYAHSQRERDDVFDSPEEGREKIEKPELAFGKSPSAEEFVRDEPSGSSRKIEIPRLDDSESFPGDDFS